MSSGTSGESTSLLQIGEVIKPQVTESQMKEIVQRLYGLKVKTFKELNSYDDINFKIIVEEEWNNPNLGEVWSHGYVLKVLNTMDSQKPKYIEAMQSLILYLVEHGFEAPKPVPSLAGQLMELEQISVAENLTKGEQIVVREHVVRLFTFIPGRMLVEVPYRAALCYKVGEYCGKLHRTLHDFHHPFYDTHTTVWSLAELPKLADFVYAVQDEGDRKMVYDILNTFQNEVIPAYSKLQIGMIHGDFNEQNILVRKNEKRKDVTDEEYDVCGVLDYGDATLSYTVFDVGMGIAYMMIDSEVIDRLDVGGHFLGGYLSQMPLNEHELAVLKTCAEGRLCQSLVMGAYTYSIDNSNTYVLTTAAKGWPCLRKLWKTPKDELMSRWQNILAEYSVQ